MKRDASTTLRKIHRRALIAALQAARGNSADAALALGISTQELNEFLDEHPAALWSSRPSAAGLSGTRPKLDVPPPDDEEPGGA